MADAVSSKAEGRRAVPRTITVILDGSSRVMEQVSLVSDVRDAQWKEVIVGVSLPMLTYKSTLPDASFSGCARSMTWVPGARSRLGKRV